MFWDGKRILNEVKVGASAIKQSQGKATKIDHLHEGMEFDGSIINAIGFYYLTKQLQLTHSCMFRLENYPFDVQAL